MQRLTLRIWQWMFRWLTREGEPHEILQSDFSRLADSIRPGDVILVEGRTHIAGVIRLVTQSSWTHAALYIGRLHEIQDRSLRCLVAAYYQADHGEQLLIEALLGEGTRVSPLSKYQGEHLRVCRPKGLCPDDAQRVIAHAIRRLGSDYDVRQLIDLARFLLPWGILPRRWRSSLFEHRAGETTRTLCSGLIAEAFNSVAFPILPFVERQEDGSLRFFRRNPRLYTPRDFDYSPYFDVIKHPFLGLDDPGVYRRLVWSASPLVYSDAGPVYRAALSTARASPPVPRPMAHLRRHLRRRRGVPSTGPDPRPLAPGTEGP